MIRRKIVILSTSVVVLSALLYFVINVTVETRKDFGTVTFKTVEMTVLGQKPIKKTETVSKKNKNPNDCLYSGCGNFY